jgi:hypothetical protein
MKKISIFIGVFLLAALGIQAAAPTTISSPAVCEPGGIFFTISSAASLDTVVKTDSVTLLDSKAFGTARDGWEYILLRDVITGDGADSVNMRLVVDALDGSGNLFYRTEVDTMTDSTGEAISLPINNSVNGWKYRIKLIGITGNGGEVILNRMYIIKRRPVTIHKNM